MSLHYHITKNTPGYSPWTGFMVDTKGDAVAALKDEKRFIRDNDYEGDLRFGGNARVDLAYMVKDRSKMFDLGFIIEAWPCVEDDCEEYE